MGAHVCAVCVLVCVPACVHVWFDARLIEWSCAGLSGCVVECVIVCARVIA